MTLPPYVGANRDMNMLHPLYRQPVELWLAQVRATFPQFEIRVTETARTLARQRYLYSLGRTRGNPDFGGRMVQVTWTLETMHRLGCALDWVPIRRSTGRAEWDARVYEAIYTQVAPQRYGLEILKNNQGRVIEWPHIQLKGGQIAAIQAGVKWDTFIGSRHA